MSCNVNDANLLMNFFELKKHSIIERLFILRSIAIAVQVTTILSLYFVMSLQIALLPLLLVIAVESLFHVASVMFYKHRPAGHLAVFFQVLADVTFLTVLMSLSGGATNAFVSLLLLPIVIAAVSLPIRLFAIISSCAVVAYSALLLNMPEHTMHQMDMNNHFIGMWANFLLSVIVVTFVVGAMARLITNREQTLALAREDQLRSEQLLALGVASAQVTHQLATPLSNLQLLFDELEEDYPHVQAVQDMRHPLHQCIEQLSYFRTLAINIRENKRRSAGVVELLEDLQDTATLQFPQTQFNVEYSNQSQVDYHAAQINADAMLQPALLNLIQNGIKSNALTHSNVIAVVVNISNGMLKLAIRDFGIGIKPTQNYLGEKLIASESGLGMAMLLSNITFERLGGRMSLVNHPEQGAIAHVELPVNGTNNGVVKVR